MEKAMYKRYENTKPFGGYQLTNVFGLVFFLPDEIDRYKNDCDFIVAYTNGHQMEGFHKHRIYTTLGGRNFIRKGNMRIYLDEVCRL